MIVAVQAVMGDTPFVPTMLGGWSHQRTFFHILLLS